MRLMRTADEPTNDMVKADASSLRCGDTSGCSVPQINNNSALMHAVT